MYLNTAASQVTVVYCSH